MNSLDKIDIKNVTEAIEHGDCPFKGDGIYTGWFHSSYDQALSIFNKIAKQNELDRATDPSLPKIEVDLTSPHQWIQLNVNGKEQAGGYWMRANSGHELNFDSQRCENIKEAETLEKGKISHTFNSYQGGDLSDTRSSGYGASLERFQDIAGINKKHRETNPVLPQIVVSKGVDAQNNPNLKLIVEPGKGAKSTVVESWDMAYDELGNEIQGKLTQMKFGEYTPHETYDPKTGKICVDNYCTSSSP